jgi:hypothetical protein
MQRDTAYLLVFTLLAMAAVVGGTWWWNEVKHPAQPAPGPLAASTPEWAMPPAPPAPQTSPPPAGGNITQRAMGQGILECTRPGGSVFYTNQEHCELADLRNQLSVIPAPQYAAPPTAPKAVTTVSRQAASTRTPSSTSCADRIGLPGTRTTPSDVPRSCKWAWGKALEIERSLAVAKDPAKSTWREPYCERLCEVYDKGCRPEDADFCFEEICGWLPGDCRNFR